MADHLIEAEGDRIKSGSLETFVDRAVLMSLGSIEGKQDLILTRLDQQDREREKQQAQIDNIDTRVQRVESRMTYFAGGIAVVGSVLYFLRERVTAFFQGF